MPSAARARVDEGRADLELNGGDAEGRGVFGYGLLFRRKESATYSTPSLRKSRSAPEPLFPARSERPPITPKSLHMAGAKFERDIDDEQRLFSAISRRLLLDALSSYSSDRTGFGG